MAPGNAPPAQRTLPPAWDYYRAGSSITTRWNDNDPYGHVNNAVYYLWFDSAVNRYLIEQGALDIENSEVIGLVVHTSCEYFAPIAFPDLVEARICVEKLGRTSVTYGVGLFRGDEKTVSAAGRFTHVYVDHSTRRPTPLSATLRSALEAISV